MIARKESFSKGKWSLLECVILRKVVQHVHGRGGGADGFVEEVHKVYHDIVEFAKTHEIEIALGKKSVASVLQKVQEQKKTLGMLI